MKTGFPLSAILVGLALVGNIFAQPAGWTYSDSLFILTTPDGANIPASASETAFPLLVRLDKDFFTFNQAKTDGSDIRFSTPSGTALSYQIEEWDATNGRASIWVKVPTITGNSRQAIMMHWGNSNAASASNGAAVFSSTNGYCSVWHLNNSMKDETGATTPTNNGTTLSTGIIGGAAHFTTAGQGINCGEKITTYPSGANPATTEVWYKTGGANMQILGWGTEEGMCMTDMMLLSPGPTIRMDCNGPNNIQETGIVPVSQWVHVLYVYQNGNSRIYVNGVLNGTNTATGGMNVPTTVKMYIGGWYGGPVAGWNFVGDIDEVRISKVARSAAWAQMEYENQKPLQTMAGLLVPAGSTFSVPQTQLTVLEGKPITIAANAGGAQKIYWILKGSGAGTIVAVDRLNFTYLAPRVTADKNIVLQVKAVYPSEVKTQDITVTIKEDQPDPVFTLSAPSTWNGRDAINVVANVSNQAAMDAKGAGTLTYAWDVANVAATRTITPGKMTLTRSQGSGKMVVTLTISNGGTPVTHSTVITVTEPASDPWVARTPEANEKPVNDQFYARDDKNVCTVYYKGTISTSPDSVFLKVYAGTTLSKRLAQKLTGNAYSFEPAIDPKLTQYKFEFGSKTGATETVLNTVTNVLCGDAYIIDGQSNAEATQFGTDDNPTKSEWIRTYGSMGGDPGSGWYTAAHTGTGQVGYWGLELARKLMTNHKIPICIINGAAGGTRIDLHQPNPANHFDISGGDAWSNPYKTYGCLLTRVTGAKLTHGIRGVLWHQGENNSGAADPTGDWDYVHYQQYFVQMSSAWKQDYPNILHYYVFQVYPIPCGMGPKDDELRNEQRTLQYLYSNMSVMSTVGFVPAGRGTCHFTTAGYMQFVMYMGPLVERDNYGMVPTTDITAPDVKRVYYTSSAKNEIALVFGQNMTWNSASTVNFYLDEVAGKVSSGSASGKTVKLTLSGASSAKTIRYVHGEDWNGNATNLLKGANGIAALTFCNMPIMPDSTTAVATLPARKAPGDVSVVMKNGTVRISFGRIVSAPLTVELVNLRGQVVVCRKIARAEAASGQMTLPSLHKGVYILKLRSIGSKDLLKKLTVY